MNNSVEIGAAIALLEQAQALQAKAMELLGRFPGETITGNSSSVSAGVAKSWQDPSVARKRSRRWAVKVDGILFSSVTDAHDALGLDWSVAERIRFRGELVEKGELCDRQGRQWVAFERTGNPNWHEELSRNDAD